MVFDNDFFNNSPLNQMGNNFAENSPFDGGSQFYSNNCGPFDYKAYKGAVHYPRLINFLKNSYNKPFNWNDFVSDRSVINKLNWPQIGFELTPIQVPLPYFSDILIPLPQVVIDPVAEVRINIPFKYEENGETKFGIFDTAILNERICNIDRQYTHRITINPTDKSLKFEFTAYYDKTQEYREQIPVMTDVEGIGGTNELNDKYKAVYLSTANPVVFYHFLLQIGEKKSDPLIKFFFEKINKAYKGLNRSNPNSLEWFYKQFSAILFDNEILDIYKIAKEDLWRDLIILLNYDASSWLIDSSNIMIRIIQDIRKQDINYLYDQFDDNPKLIKDIYDYLDNESKSSEHDGQMVPNKTIFASTLFAVTIDHHQNKKIPLTATIQFTIDENNRVDSNLFKKHDNSDEKYRLTQQVKVSSTYTMDITSNYSNGRQISSWRWESIPSQSHPLHPLELVYLTTVIGDGDKKQSITLVCPAIFVKDLAYVAEWERVEYAIRITGDVVGVILGVASLGSSSTLMFALAIADIGISGGDLLLQALKEDLMQTDWGKKLLAFWEQIYTLGGITIAIAQAPALIKGLLEAGGGLLKAARNASQTAKDFIKAMLKRVISEINSRRGLRNIKNIEIGAEALDIRGVHSLAAKRLEDVGVIFAKIDNGDPKPRYAAYYKGEELVEATDAETLRKELADAWWAKDLKSVLDDLLLRKTGVGGFLKYKKIISRNMLGQSHENACGPTCLKVIADENNLKSPLTGFAYTEEEIQILAKTTVEDGTEMGGFGKVFESIFKEEAVLTQFYEESQVINFLKSRPTNEGSWITFISPIRLGKTHTIIVDKIIGNEIFIRDPWPNGAGLFKQGEAGVEAVADLDEFAKQWINAQCFRLKLVKK